tara:strand:- start:211 stop:330 length:120 start_codon:yes stop_codon:yes gene_type:complete
MIKDILGSTILLIFALGWIDLGQGPQYTWWALIQYAGSV